MICELQAKINQLKYLQQKQQQCQKKCLNSWRTQIKRAQISITVVIVTGAFQMQIAHWPRIPFAVFCIILFGEPIRGFPSLK